MKFIMIALFIVNAGFAQDRMSAVDAKEMAEETGNLLLNVVETAIVDVWEESDKFARDRKKMENGKEFTSNIFLSQNVFPNSQEFSGADVEIGLAGSVRQNYTRIEIESMKLPVGDFSFKGVSSPVRTGVGSHRNHAFVDSAEDCNFSFLVIDNHIKNLLIKSGSTLVEAGGDLQACVNMVKSELQEILSKRISVGEYTSKKEREVLAEEKELEKEVEEVARELEYKQEIETNLDEVSISGKRRIKGKKSKKTSSKTSLRSSSSFNYFETRTSSSSTGSSSSRRSSSRSSSSNR